VARPKLAKKEEEERTHGTRKEWSHGRGRHQSKLSNFSSDLYPKEKGEV